VQDYSAKASDYFSNARREIHPLLPRRSASVLEVGCGTGATLCWLKELGVAKHTTGIELFDSAAQLARDKVDEVYVGDAEKLVPAEFPPESFDLIVCLDVLEHASRSVDIRASRREAPETGRYVDWQYSQRSASVCLDRSRCVRAVDISIQGNLGPNSLAVLYLFQRASANDFGASTACGCCLQHRSQDFKVGFPQLLNARLA
jgi:SAM-dependent methyltransferase